MRKSVDCRKFPGSNCSVEISGEEDELLPLALHHAVTKHGYEDSKEVREELKASFENA